MRLSEFTRRSTGYRIRAELTPCGPPPIDSGGKPPAVGTARSS